MFCLVKKEVKVLVRNDKNHWKFRSRKYQKYLEIQALKIHSFRAQFLLSSMKIIQNEKGKVQAERGNKVNLDVRTCTQFTIEQWKSWRKVSKTSKQPRSNKTLSYLIPFTHWPPHKTKKFSILIFLPPKEALTFHLEEKFLYRALETGVNSFRK